MTASSSSSSVTCVCEDVTGETGHRESGRGERGRMWREGEREGMLSSKVCTARGREKKGGEEPRSDDLMLFSITIYLPSAPSRSGDEGNERRRPQVDEARGSRGKPGTGGNKEGEKASVGEDALARTVPLDQAFRNRLGEPNPSSDVVGTTLGRQATRGSGSFVSSRFLLPFFQRAPSSRPPSVRSRPLPSQMSSVSMCRCMQLISITSDLRMRSTKSDLLDARGQEMKRRTVGQQRAAGQSREWEEGRGRSSTGRRSLNGVERRSFHLDEENIAPNSCSCFLWPDRKYCTISISTANVYQPRKVRRSLNRRRTSLSSKIPLPPSVRRSRPPLPSTSCRLRALPTPSYADALSTRKSRPRRRLASEGMPPTPA